MPDGGRGTDENEAYENTIIDLTNEADEWSRKFDQARAEVEQLREERDTAQRDLERYKGFERRDRVLIVRLREALREIAEMESVRTFMDDGQPSIVVRDSEMRVIARTALDDEGERDGR